MTIEDYIAKHGLNRQSDWPGVAGRVLEAIPLVYVDPDKPQDYSRDDRFTIHTKEDEHHVVCRNVTKNLFRIIRYAAARKRYRWSKWMASDIDYEVQELEKMSPARGKMHQED